MKAFAQNQRGLRHAKIFVEFGIVRCLHAVVGPKNLISIGKLHRVVRLLTGVSRCKRCVPWCMPVLGEDHIGEGRRDAVDDGYHGVSIFDRQTAAGHETVLHIDDEQRAVVIGLDRCARHHSRRAACDIQLRGDDRGTRANCCLQDSATIHEGFSISMHQILAQLRDDVPL